MIPDLAGVLDEGTVVVDESAFELIGFSLEGFEAAGAEVGDLFVGAHPGKSSARS